MSCHAHTNTTQRYNSALCYVYTYVQILSFSLLCINCFQKKFINTIDNTWLIYNYNTASNLRYTHVIFRLESFMSQGGYYTISTMPLTILDVYFSADNFSHICTVWYSAIYKHFSSQCRAEIAKCAITETIIGEVEPHPGLDQFLPALSRQEGV